MQETQILLIHRSTMNDSIGRKSLRGKVFLPENFLPFLGYLTSVTNSLDRMLWVVITSQDQLKSGVKPVV